ncbi:unnamed protein product [Macrosiphum euphorbiae]|uniref:Uncharacterized protein n=1 Tax=Macrosiphum euphorbiae TaxID=13131 RepID=A0AAV0VY88_9HEMI|nr:unnamed protein product [Macrosiphum euphorbiae]
MLTASLILFLLTDIHCSRIKSELNKFRQTGSKTGILLVYKERDQKGNYKLNYRSTRSIGIYLLYLWPRTMLLWTSGKSSMDYRDVTQMITISGSP